MRACVKAFTKLSKPMMRLRFKCRSGGMESHLLSVHKWNSQAANNHVVYNCVLSSKVSIRLDSRKRPSGSRI